MSLRPTSAEETAEAVRAHERIAPAGGGTKKALVGAGEVIELGELAGIIQYEHAEYTFTAKAGTPVQEVAAALEEKGQYLPFDPIFLAAGATLGGTVASGISGSGRFRYGGLRDFLIGVQFVDGAGKLVRSGGKVVKNAAGFDLPKFLVGSLGRFGIITEVSFKVFPAHESTATWEVGCPDHAEAVARLVEMASSRWEADALDYDANAKKLFVRLGGPEKALDLLGGEIAKRWPGEVQRLEDEAFWQSGREGLWASDAALVKVPITPSRLVPWEERMDEIPGSKRRYSSGGAVGWLAVESGQLDAVDRSLTECDLSGLLVIGADRPEPWLGRRRAPEVLHAVKRALDPDNRFPGI